MSGISDKHMSTTYYVDDGLEIVEEISPSLGPLMEKYRAKDARERGIHGVETETVVYTFSTSVNAQLKKVADLTIEVVPEDSDPLASGSDLYGEFLAPEG